jgi:hypothetical protein
MKASFADLARRRLGSLPPGAPTAELQQAKADFIEAVISRNYRAAWAANAVIARSGRPEPAPAPAERAKRERRHEAEVHGTVADSDDVGILRLPSESLPSFDGFTFLTTTDIDVSRPDPRERYGFCGYPEEFSVRTPGSPFFYNTVLAEPEGPLRDFDPEVNFLLAMDEARTRTPTGRLTKFPVSLGGISGCAVWRITQGGAAATWTSAQARVVGIETGVYGDGPVKKIKASSWALVLGMIRQQYPALRPSLDLTIPA